MQQCFEFVEDVEFEGQADHKVLFVLEPINLMFPHKLTFISNKLTVRINKFNNCKCQIGYSLSAVKLSSPNYEKQTFMLMTAKSKFHF